VSANSHPTPRTILAARARLARLILVGATLASIDPAVAQDRDARERQLQAVRTRIETTTRELNETRGQRDQLREQVRQLERRIGSLSAALRRTDRQIRIDQQQLRALRRQRESAGRDMTEQARALEREIQLAYALGRQDYVKLLLNQEDPARVARTLTYYRYLTAARAERRAALEAKLARVRQLEDQIEERDRQFAARRASAAQETQTLETARAERAALLSQRNREVRERSRELDRLKADEQRLEGLVERITRYLPELPPPDKDARFGSLRGRLPWPTRGRLSARYDELKGVANLRWRGVLIAAPEGTEIHAVASGRVAYADWLRGFGLLLILDHGDGYMTLYGHNQAMHKEVGDWVEAGEVIGAVGSSGDALETGLYFEIRQRGEPVDPLAWVGGRTRAAHR
jgi:septal ring factor EnvC (AmiA/AmiB activator)